MSRHGKHSPGYHAKYRAKNRERINANNAEWQRKDRLRRGIKPHVPKEWTVTSRQQRLQVKQNVISHYGGKCSCCGESELIFLTIDHIHNDGAKCRSEQGNGYHLYQWIIRHNYPSDFQVLCWNCNSGKYLNGGICPHQTKGVE